MRNPRAHVEPAASVAGGSRADTTALLELILAELRGLRADLAARGFPSEVAASRCTDKAVADLFRAIAATTKDPDDRSGQLVFTVSELLLHAEVVAGRSADHRLHSAIVAAVGAINGRQLGQLFRRVEGADVDGLRVVRVGVGRDGIAWRVASFAGLKPALTVAPSR